MLTARGTVLTQLRVDLSLDMILSPRDGPAAVGVLGAVTEGSEASSSVAGASSAAAPQGATAHRLCLRHPASGLTYALAAFRTLPPYFEPNPSPSAYPAWLPSRMLLIEAFRPSILHHLVFAVLASAQRR